jgi:hypothetical protein
MSTVHRLDYVLTGQIMKKNWSYLELKKIIGILILACFCNTIFGEAHGKSFPYKKTNCKILSGFQSVLSDDARRFVIIGEIHGTEQSPDMFGDLVCLAAAQGAVNVILEFPISQSDVLNKFVASQGTREDYRALISSWIWDLRYADGRSSVAMFHLVERLRKMRASGLNIEVYTSQPDFATLSESQHYYELAMADRWSQIAALRPQARTLVLTGQVHAKLWVKDDVSFAGAASFLPPKFVVTLVPEAEGGKAWNLEDKDAGLHSLDGLPAKWRGLKVESVANSLMLGTYALGEAALPSIPAMRDSSTAAFR